MKNLSFNEESKYKPIIAIDFDGVINPYKSGFISNEDIPDSPTDGIDEFIADMRNLGYLIIIFSSRCTTDEGTEGIKKYLSKHNILVDGFTGEKIPAFLYIDDRAIYFDGNARGLRERVLNFRVWWENYPNNSSYIDRTESIANINYLIESLNGDTGNINDGYHTFDELYKHRAVLFAALCNKDKNNAWKSKKHSDGTMYDGMFIVGLNTINGQITYHYDMNMWQLFGVKELEFAPVWDGSTPNDVLDRLIQYGDV